jgi:2',3'-cyclic-nucleotide 2'-phosphodiesterase (5'-nucleotidase family)
MSEVGYDAMSMGNREFHFLERGLKTKTGLARFPILSANLRGQSDELSRTVKPYIVKTLGDTRVALFGLTVPMITQKMLASKFSPYWFEDPLVAAAELVPRLRECADFVIALTHIGLEKDQLLAASVPGIDLIVGGHTHAVLEDLIRVGDTVIVQAGSWGHFLGEVQVSVPDQPEKHSAMEARLISLPR